MRYHFECLDCGYDDKEGRLLEENETYCPQCFRDSLHLVTVKRWPADETPEKGLKYYGLGIADKNGPTRKFLSAGNESLQDYALSLIQREKPDDAPFKVVELFYKDGASETKP